MKTIGYITTTVVLVICSIITHGWALSKLWAWFVVTTLNAPPLTIPAAIGLATIVKLFRPLAKRDKENRSVDELIESAFISIMSPLVGVGIGWLVKLWM